MAVQKEAWIFVLDLGQTMSIVAEDRDQTNLDWAMTYVWAKISYLVSLNRKTVNAGVIGLRTDNTDNIMGQDEAYSHIEVLYPITPCTMDHITNLRDIFVPSHQNKGDALSALIIAITMMMEFVKKLKYKQTIILVTDAMAPIDDDDMSEVIKQIKQHKIGLKILGIDFDEPEIGYKEESKSLQKAKNEMILHRLADSCDGICINISIPISEMHIPVVKTPRPYKSYEGVLALGTEGKALMETAASNICIEVERYFKTKQASPPSATIVVVRDDKVKVEEDLGIEPQTDFTEVIQARSYFIDDPSFSGGRKDVAFDQLAKGYEYGRTAVFINKADENVTNLETFKSFTIIGFVAKENYDLVFGMGEVGMTIASRSEPKSIMGFASLVEGLQTAEAYAIGRLVLKDMKEPKLVLLIPDAEAQCLYDVSLPFAEDIRTYRFPPLDKALLTNTKHQLLPDDDLDEAMNNYVDSMDLSQVDVDDGNSTEYILTNMNFNPLIHRINSAIQKRAVNRTSKIDLIPPVLLQYTEPFSELLDYASSSIKTLIKTADVKEIPLKAKYQKKRDAIKPLSGLDPDSLLGASEKKSGPISKNNTVPDFKRALEASLSEDSKIQAAVQQMNTIISSFISESFGGNQNDRVIELVRVMREELLSFEKPAIYNDFLRDLKTRLLAKELGGDRRDLWFQMIKISRLGLIRNDQCEGSPVSVLEASEFYNSN